MHASANTAAFASVIRFPSVRPRRTAPPFSSVTRREVAMKLKLQVFTGSIDGSRRALVAAGSKSEAVDLIRAAGFAIDGAHFTQFFCQSANVAERTLAIATPRVVFSRREENDVAGGFAPVATLTAAVN